MVSIQLFQPHDLRRILQIEAEAFHEHAWAADLFQQYASNCDNLFFVAKLKRVIVGYSIACLTNQRAELVSLAVLKRFREQGIAQKLLSQTLRKLKLTRVGALSLTVRRDNLNAIRFYRRYGFVRTHTIPAYYEDGTTGWRMKKML